MRKFICILLAFTMLLAVAGCGKSSTPSTADNSDTANPAATEPGAAPQTAKTTMIVSSYSDPQTLNPYSIDNRNAMRIYFQVYERLIDRGEESGSFVGVLAESWDIADDGLSITFNLRKGVKFHNGEEMKASDVLFSFKTMATYGTVTSGVDWMSFDEATAPDEYTVVLPLKYKSSLTLWTLARSNMIIVNEKAWTEMGESVATRAVGTGPFMVKDGDYLLNDQITLTRFDEYWDGPVALEKVVMRFIPESTQAAIELESGGIDLQLDVAALDYQRIEDSDKMKLEFFPTNTIDMLHFNNNMKPFDDYRVRQAIAYAINREDIFKAVYREWGQIAYSVISPEIFAYTNEFEGENWPYKLDYDKSKALLAEAGYPDGFTFDLCIDQDVNRQAVSEIIKNQLTNIGVTANIVNMEQSALNDMIAQNTAQSWCFGISAASMEPDLAMFVRYHKSVATNGGSNHTRFSNDAYSELLDKARLSFDNAEKLQYYTEAQRIWMEQCPSVPYYVRPQVTASVMNLKGLRGYGEVYLFKNCYFE